MEVWNHIQVVSTKASRNPLMNTSIRRILSHALRLSSVHTHTQEKNKNNNLIESPFYKDMM